MRSSNDMATNETRNSPYIGLMPFTESDAHFFFGRSSEIEIVSANLRAAPLTLLYGPSGCGKSSLLHAGVLKKMMEQSLQNVRAKGTPEYAVALFNDWSGNILSGLADSIHVAMLKAQNIRGLEPVPAPSFITLIENTIERFGLKLLIILDQFEEYFQHNDKTVEETTFTDDWVAVVNRQGLPVHFMISMRDDTLHKLDCFKGRVPNLFGNRLAINNLDVAAAREAITGPLDAYNKLFRADQKSFTIESKLVEEVLSQIRDEKIGLGPTVATDGPLLANSLDNSHIDTTYLQLVMTRIWNEEVKGGSAALRWATFMKLGGAKSIVDTHLDSVMKTFSISERNIAARCFKYLANPSGLKIALTVPTLAKWANLPENMIAPVLDRLVHLDRPDSSLTETRILRPVEIWSGKSRQLGFEVAHDALIASILNWRDRWAEKTVRRRAWWVGLVCVVLVVGIAGGFVFNNYDNYRNKVQNVNSTIKNKNDKISEEEAAKNTLKNKALREEEASKRLVQIVVGLRKETPDEKKKALVALHELLKSEDIPKELFPLIEQLVSGIDTPEALSVKNDLKRYTDIAANPSKYTDLQPRVYIQIQSAEQQAGAEQIQRLLISNKFIVPGIEKVGDRTPDSTEVRYFKNNDGSSQLSERVKSLLEGMKISDVKVKFIPGFEDSTRIRPKHLEIWVGAGAFTYR